MIAALLLAWLQAAAAPPPLAPSEIVAAAPDGDWTAVPPERLLVMELDGGRRVLIQLAPGFAPAHVANIAALAAARWWDGAGVNRVQDNYVVQWGGAASGPKPLPAGVTPRPPAEYDRAAAGLALRPFPYPDPYGTPVFAEDWPATVRDGRVALAHCYGMVGVGREMPPDTGSGAELYTVIGQAPRHLDRNVALVGRVVAGMEHLSALPRGTAAMGVYATPAEWTRIARVQLARALAPAERPRVEVMRTASASFARYLAARADRRDAFFVQPAGATDLCNAPVPVRVRPAG